MDALSLQFRILIFVSAGQPDGPSTDDASPRSRPRVVAAFMLVARPLTVLVSLVPDRRARWSGVRLRFFLGARDGDHRHCARRPRPGRGGGWRQRVHPGRSDGRDRDPHRAGEHHAACRALASTEDRLISASDLGSWTGLGILDASLFQWRCPIATNVSHLKHTRIDLAEDVKKRMIELLNTHVVHLTDLWNQTKLAHWNVRGPHFLSYHKMLDDLAAHLVEAIDDVAERATALGGVAGCRFRVSRSRRSCRSGICQ